MSDYIEREAVIKFAESNKAVSQALADIVDIREIVNDVPSADVIKVVRCKDCKYHDYCSIKEESLFDDECFCSLGKMKGAVNG